MLNSVKSINLFKYYFGQQSSRVFISTFVKLFNYNENFSSSNLKRFSSFNEFTNQTNVTNQKESGEIDFVLKELRLGENDILKVRLQQGKSGKRFIKLTNMYKTQNEWKWIDLPNLIVPDDAYKFVRALDQIIIDSAVNKKSSEKDKLSLKIFHKKDSEHGEIEHSFRIPIDSVLWIRQTIAEILGEFDGSEELPKLPVVDQTNVKNQKKTNEAVLVFKKLQLGKNYNIGIKLQQGKSEKIIIKLIKMYKIQNEWKYINFPNLLMPEDVYNFVRGLDQIISACDGEKFFDEKNSSKELAFEEIITVFNDISIILYRDKEGKLRLKLLLKRKTEYGINTIKLDKFYISIESLLWIRETIAKILEEHDGSEELPKMPIVEFPVISNR